MNPNIPASPHRRTACRSFVSVVTTTAALAFVAPLSAADWYLDKTQPRYSSWDTLTDWKPNDNGTGTSPGALSSADTYHLNGFVLRTPEVNTSVAFGGGVLSLTNSADKLSLKHTGTAVATIPSLVTTTGLIINDKSGGTKRVQIGHYDNRSGSTSFAASGSEGISLDIGTLVGSGQMRFYNGGTYYLSVGNGHSYDGDIYVQSGQIDFDNDFATAGSLTINSGARAALDRTVTFTGLTIAGVSYPPNTYTFNTLQSEHPAVFTSGSSGAAIIVRPPRTWYLSTHQPIGASWDTLAHWRANPDGTGATADSINSFDNYVNQVSGRTLRTPETTATFGGGSLVLSSGANLTLKAQSGRTSTIPAFVTSGSVSITNGFSNITQPLIVGDWDIPSGVTQVSVPGGNTVKLIVDSLSGAGTLQFQNGGKYVLDVHEANKFTGTIRNAAGTLTIDRQLGTNGPLVVDSGAKLILNKPAFFTSIKLGSTFLPAGYHSYAWLRANYAAYFPAGGNSNAFLAVHTADTTGPEPLLGVNIAGGDFTPGVIPGQLNWEYTYPSEARVQYAHSKGIKLIRIPFRWERVQRSLFADLHEADMVALDASINYATARGMKVVLDMHNYARRKPNNTTEVIIGTGSVSYASFADVWRKLADRYKNNPSIWAYGIMNEPHDIDIAAWNTIAQTAIDAIREKDLVHHVLVGGNHWSNARGWASINRGLKVSDPVGRLIYEAHCYFDSNNDGVYNSYTSEGGSPTLGVERVKEFVEWLQARGAHGFVGEYGVPYNDSRWNTTLANFLAYLKANGVSGTYWATGPWPTSDLINVEPSTSGVDRPQMAVIQQYATP